MTEGQASVGEVKPVNHYNLMEWAGAFGDLGTLIPFIVAYITILKMNPTSILLVFGLCLIFSGLFYKTPIPIQPMKAIGAAAIAKAGVTMGMVFGAGIVTGLFWALMGITNVIGFLGKVGQKARCHRNYSGGWPELC